MIRKFATGVIVLLAASGVAMRTSAQEETIQRSFGGESVHLDLSVGSYRVTSSPDNRIKITPRTKTHQVSVRLNVSTSGRRADVKVIGPKDGFDADIELPTRVNIVIGLAAGSLYVRGIEGSKDISAGTGEIEIAIGDREQYRRVTVSVQSGGLSVPGFSDNARGLRSLEWTGKGAYDLQVRLNAGNVTQR